METEGHQIASHTWTHQDLSKVPAYMRRKQLWNLEMALNNIVGKIPTYMRPPYSSCDSACQKDVDDLGYHSISFDVDTDDYNQNNASKIQISKDRFKTNVTTNLANTEKNASLVISHDILEQTAHNLTEYMLSTLTQLGLKAVTVGECLGDPEENWYRQFNGSESDSTSTPSSTAGSAQASSSSSGSAAPEQSASSASSLIQTSNQFAYASFAVLLSILVALAV